MTSRICPLCLRAINGEVCGGCNVRALREDELVAPDPLLGSMFAGHYHVVSVLGDGGMGIVYKARQTTMDRLVALKVLRRDLVRDVSSVQRFYREMRATARIEHPNSVRVYEFGHADDGALFLAMELLDGDTLAAEMQRIGRFPPTRVVRVGIQIAKALRAAHRERIVHRDLKPENIVLIDQYGEADFVKVLDFGIARFASPDSREDARSLTRTGLVVGTPAYVSPEQATGSAVDHRADLYSLGVVLYQMAAGTLPFDDTNTMTVLYKHVYEPPPRPSRIGITGIPTALEDLIMTLLAKNPAERPPSADALITLLSVSLTSAANPAPAPAVRSRIIRDTVPSPFERPEPLDPLDRRSGEDRRSSPHGAGVSRFRLPWRARVAPQLRLALLVVVTVGAMVMMTTDRLFGEGTPEPLEGHGLRSGNLLSPLEIRLIGDGAAGGLDDCAPSESPPAESRARRDPDEVHVNPGSAARLFPGDAPTLH